MILLLVLLLRSASYDITSQKGNKLIAKLAVFKALFGFVMTLFLVLNHHAQVVNWNKESPVPVSGTCCLEGLFLIMGILIYRETQKIVKILEFEFYDKQLSNYFEITL